MGKSAVGCEVLLPARQCRRASGATAALPLVLTAVALTLREALPPGYLLEVGGTVEESARGQSSVNAGLPLFVLVVITLLMLQLRRFSLTTMVFLTAPLGLIGPPSGAWCASRMRALRLEAELPRQSLRESVVGSHDEPWPGPGRRRRWLSARESYHR